MKKLYEPVVGGGIVDKLAGGLKEQELVCTLGNRVIKVIKTQADRWANQFSVTKDVKGVFGLLEFSGLY